MVALVLHGVDAVVDAIVDAVVDAIVDAASDAVVSLVWLSLLFCCCSCYQFLQL